MNQRKINKAKRIIRFLEQLYYNKSKLNEEIKQVTKELNELFESMTKEEYDLFIKEEGYHVKK